MVTLFFPERDLVGQPPPCEDGCPSYSKCKSERLACTEFFLYAEGRIRREPNRIPSKTVYLRLFDE